MSNSLVDTMMAQMNDQNSQSDLNYHPDAMMMMQRNQMNPGQVRMGEVNYMPPEQMHAQMPSAGYGMPMPMQMQPQMQMQQQQSPMMMPESPEIMEIDSPDMSKYGMDEEEESSWFDQLLDEIRAPLIVVVLAFLMSMPQINALMRNGLSRLTTNQLYLNLIQALLIGFMFWGANKFL